MKTKNIIYRLSLLFVVFAMTTSAWAKSDAKDAKAPPFFRTIKIYSESDWKHLCKRVEDGESDLEVFLMRDISLSDPPLVGEHRPFIGNFHGNGHTIRFNHGIPIGWRIALFKSVQNATIENLNVKASIWASSYKLSGLVCDAAGRTTISNCVIDADIKCAYEGGASEIAGMVTYVLPNANVTINDCIVKGKFNATTSAGQSGMSGFVHTMKGSCTLNNCLYFGENNATAGNTFAPSGTTLNNCYFTRTCGTTQGMMTVDLQLESGYLTYLLQKGRSNMVWGQKLGTDSEPMLTTDESKRICKVAFTYNGSESATRYANKGGTVASLPIFIVKNLVGLGYNEHHYYAIAFADNFSTATIVTADMQVAFSFTEKDHYEITSAADWKTFCDAVNDGQNKIDAKLMRNVDLGSEINMVGNDSKEYGGTFDGQNHTLTLNWNATTNDIAPFRFLRGATIKNLRTEGTIKSSSYFLGGLISEAYGKNSVSNCISNVNITSTYTDNRCGAGGLISYIGSKSSVNITDCLVKGTINGTGAGRKGMSGFVFVQNGTCTLNNCLYLGENNADNSDNRPHTFAYNATINNCYYLNACGSTQGTQISDAQLKSGEVAYKLQARRNNMVWGQDLNKDTEPLLTADGAKRVCKVEFTYNNRVKATRYATHGKAIYGSMPTFTPKDLLGSDYNEHHYYSGIAFEDGFNGSTTVNTDRTVALTFNKKDYYEIATKEDWKEFCDIVNGGQNAVDAKLTQDIDLGSEINMVGNDNNKYSGTFDGQNHTLKLDWSNTNGLLAPFYRVENTTIRNLRTEGNIKSSYSLLSGLILTVYGKTTITNCVSAVNITSTYNGSGCVIAGMILEIPYGAVVTFTDCIVKGKYNTTLKEGSISVSGFISGHNGTSTFNNCIYLGDNVPGGYTFAAYTYLGPTLNNCYYLNACGIAQGTKITAEQLKNGEVTKKLQNNRTDKCYWAQQLGEMPDFYNAADKSKANYVYYDAAKKGWTCDDFRLTDGTAMPIGLDFTAATVTYERNFNGAQKATLCLPYDLYAQGFKAYTLSGGNKNEVHFKEVDDKLPAYTPYYITANGMPQLGGRNIEVKAYKADKMTTPAAGYKFTGTVAGVSNATAAADNAYILQDDGKFHKVTTTNSAATIPAYRAYIICPPQASGAKQFSVVLDGETTGIGSTTNEATDGKNGPVYDLQGRRVADRLADARHRLPAGVYIVGGRKVVVK